MLFSSRLNKSISMKIGWIILNAQVKNLGIVSLTFHIQSSNMFFLLLFNIYSKSAHLSRLPTTIFIQTSILTGLSATILPLSLRPKQHAKEWSHYNRSLICHCTKPSVLSHLAWSKRKVPAKFSMTRSMLPLWAQSPSPVPFQSPWPPYSFQNKSVRPGHILLFLPELLFLQIFMWLKHHHIYKVFPDHLFFLL